MRTEDIGLIDAWNRLEDELVAYGWSPSQTKLQPFSSPEERGSDSSHKLARAYLAENINRIRSVICDGNNVKIEIITASSTASSVSDALLAAGIPFASVANLLCILGLTKFCQNVNPQFNSKDVNDA